MQTEGDRRSEGAHQDADNCFLVRGGGSSTFLFLSFSIFKFFYIEKKGDISRTVS